jgi:hypothetical protein
MYAILLTFDEQVGFAELVYKKYMEMWPECPLIFRIPFNKKNKCKSYDYFYSQSNVELIKTGRPIRETMSNLLSDIPNDEWVFWCIDDRYPNFIYNNESCNDQLNFLYNSLNEVSSGIDRVKLIKHKEKITEKQVVVGGKLKFLFGAEGSAHGAWHHSFTRAKQLKWEFLRKKLGADYKINNLTYRKLNKKHYFQSVIPVKSLISFAEPCISGKVTPNGLAELKKYNCPIPNYKVHRFGKKFFHNGLVEKVYG